MSAEPGRSLRDEAVLELADGPQARPSYSVLNEWREWYADYLSMHLEFEDGGGQTVRTQLENSYQPGYGKRYYAKLKDFERGVEHRYDGMTTVMLTFTASHVNADGDPRCPADHMREIADGYDAARKQAHQALDGRNWEYARVWEPHDDGYGHLHLALFIDDAGTHSEIVADDFESVMHSHVDNCAPAGSAAHRNVPCAEHEGAAPTPWQSAEATCGDCTTAVSVNDEVNNLGTYVSEYIGVFGEDPLNRPISEQLFYAVTWATTTRRVDFSNGAHEIISSARLRREQGLRPEERGGGDSSGGGGESGGESGGGESGGEASCETAEQDDSDGWSVSSICTVRRGQPEYSDATGGGVATTAIEGRPGLDPPATRE